jgi:hypothetical protein
MRITTAHIVVLIVLAFPALADTTPVSASEELNAANLAKAIAEARKAQAEAELAATKARLGTGDVTAPYSGTITPGTGAGTIEAYVLSGDAVAGAARTIAARVREKQPAAILLMSGAEIPRFDMLISFRLGRKILEDAYADAKRAHDELLKLLFAPKDNESKDQPPPPGGAPALAGAAYALDSINKILGFFRADYTIAGTDISWDDSLLVHAVAGELAGSTPTTMPAQFNRAALDAENDPIFGALRSIAEKRADAQVRIAQLDKMATDLDDQIKKENEPRKTELSKRLALVRQVADKWRALLSLYDSHFAKLGTPDDKGNIPAAVLAKESAISEALKARNAHLLAVKTQKSGGSYYTKKNMWTFFGAMPFYAAGGTVASFVLLDGTSGKVLDAGAIPIHNGYRRVDEIEQAFQPAPKQTR